MNEQRERESTDTDRFAEPSHGWAPDVGEGGSERATEANRKAFEGPEHSSGSSTPADNTAGRVGPTDTNPDAPHGVGDSSTASGEEYAEESSGETHGTKGAGRPYGTTDQDAGVDDSSNVQQHMPDVQTGDQGG